MRWLACITAWAMLVSGTSLAGTVHGTGGGNEFNHFVNTAFDFHIGAPTTWQCSGCDAPVTVTHGISDTTWKFASPEGTTWITIDFIANFPARNEVELKAEI